MKVSWYVVLKFHEHANGRSLNIYYGLYTVTTSLLSDDTKG